VVDADYTAQDHSFRENDHYAGAKYDITLRWLGPGRGRRLANIGCGAGLFNRMAADAGFTVEACEPDPAAYELAAESAPDGVVVHCAGLFDAPIAAGADVVVMHDVLEHIEDEAGAVARLAELVAANGALVISVPALQQLFGLHDEMLGHYRRYTRGQLKAALEPAFTIDRTRYFGFTFIPVTAYFSRWKRKPYPTGPAGQESFVGKAFAAACRVEARVPTPVGTSVLALAHRPA
jgi:2-polyprenyl-3-methyl-5-hydroxy-6-metoxy-1,4-benzoquinol methylase